MNWEFRAIPESEGPEVRHLLQGIFNPQGDPVFLSPAQMHWKFWEPHPFWEGSRSYGFSNPEGHLVAHACAWPFLLRTQQGTLTGVHPIDWGAQPQARGAGARLLRQIRALKEICCCTGGTEIAQVVVRQSGFQPVTHMKMLARPLRPLRQALTHQRRNWKLPARWARNTLWAMQGARVPADWTATPALPEEIPETVLPSPAPGLAVAGRSAALFRYLSKCPTARFQLWLIRHKGEPRGYFLIGFVPGQARIADAWVTDSNPEAWAALFPLAIQAALTEPDAAEIIAGATLAAALEGAVSCGFRPSGEWPVMLYDPTGRLAQIQQIHLQMADNDSSFLHNNPSGCRRIDYAT